MAYNLDDNLQQEDSLREGLVIRIKGQDRNFYVAKVDSSEIKTIELTKQNLIKTQSPYYYINNYRYFLRDVYQPDIEVLKDIGKLKTKKDLMPLQDYKKLEDYIT